MINPAHLPDAALREVVQDALAFDARVTAAHIGLTAAGVMVCPQEQPDWREVRQARSSGRPVWTR